MNAETIGLSNEEFARAIHEGAFNEEEMENAVQMGVLSDKELEKLFDPWKAKTREARRRLKDFEWQKKLARAQQESLLGERPDGTFNAFVGQWLLPGTDGQDDTFCVEWEEDGAESIFVISDEDGAMLATGDLISEAVNEYITAIEKDA